MIQTKDALHFVSFDNINLLNEWICEEQSLFLWREYKLRGYWDTFSALTLDEYIHFDDEDELSGNVHLLKCLIDDFSNIPLQD